MNLIIRGEGGCVGGRGGWARGKRGLSDDSCQIGVPAVGVSYSNVYTNISAPQQLSALAFFTNIANAHREPLLVIIIIFSH